jgi:NADH-quinone oxidoreductase subunit N
MNYAIPVPPLWPALPEIILAVGALALVLFGAFKGERSTGIVRAAALGLLLFAMAVVLMMPSERVLTFSGSFVFDGFAKFMKALILIGSATALYLSSDFFRREKIDRFEYPILIVLATTGMLVMSSANDLIALYMGLELLSLSSYVIAAFHRDDARSTEAGLKYFMLGALSSGMLLYGASLVYGFTGTVQFDGIATVLQGDPGLGAILGLVFVSAGIAFKLSAAPFHMWTPDVYEGAPTPVTAFLASAPKAAAMALAVRLFVGAFPNILGEWRQIVVFLAIASMLLGSFAAIGQSNIKRLMAYSSIGNVGYALIGLAAGTIDGVQSVLIYMAIYLVMTLGTFACILGMRRQGVNMEGVDDLRGLAQTHPGHAFCLAIMMLSLAGIPPLAGFFSKLYVFMAAVEAGLVALAVVGAVSSVIGAYYYLRIVKIMYFDEPAGRFEPLPRNVQAVLAVTTVFVLGFGFIAAPLFGAATVAARSLF